MSDNKTCDRDGNNNVDDVDDVDDGNDVRSDNIKMMNDELKHWMNEYGRYENSLRMGVGDKCSIIALMGRIGRRINKLNKEINNITLKQ